MNNVLHTFILFKPQWPDLLLHYKKWQWYIKVYCNSFKNYNDNSGPLYILCETVACVMNNVLLHKLNLWKLYETVEF